MCSQRLTVSILLAALCSGAPALALDVVADSTDTVSLAHAAVAASSSAAEPLVLRNVDAPRPLFALPDAPPLQSPAAKAPSAAVPPRAHAVEPDVVTCPAQGPP